MTRPSRAAEYPAPLRPLRPIGASSPIDTTVAPRTPAPEAGPNRPQALAVTARLTAEGTLLAGLLSSRGGEHGMTAITTPVALVARGAPARELARALGEAIATSGLFYESHLAEWIVGLRSLAGLQREATQRLHAARAEAQRSTSDDGARAESRLAEATLDDRGVPERSGAPGIAPGQAAFVRQQLEVLAAQALVWRGEPWPDQPVALTLTRAGGESAPEDPGDEHWHARVEINLPELGPIELSVGFARSGMSIRAMTDSDAARAALQRHADGFRAALATHQIELRSLALERIDHVGT